MRIPPETLVVGGLSAVWGVGAGMLHGAMQADPDFEQKPDPPDRFSRFMISAAVASPLVAIAAGAAYMGSIYPRSAAIVAAATGAGFLAGTVGGAVATAMGGIDWYFAPDDPRSRDYPKKTDPVP